ncbi:MAG: hypothetical protein NTX58_10600 [Actinobacteria bacterium]|nr:hypothetical protein [Actinomycetota bacterium]
MADDFYFRFQSVTLAEHWVNRVDPLVQDVQPLEGIAAFSHRSFIHCRIMPLQRYATAATN